MTLLLLTDLGFKRFYLTPELHINLAARRKLV